LKASRQHNALVHLAHCEEQPQGPRPQIPRGNICGVTIRTRAAGAAPAPRVPSGFVRARRGQQMRATHVLFSPSRRTAPCRRFGRDQPDARLQDRRPWRRRWHRPGALPWLVDSAASRALPLRVYRDRNPPSLVYDISDPLATRAAPLAPAQAEPPGDGALVLRRCPHHPR